MINVLLNTILSHCRYLKRLIMSLFVCIVFLSYINSQQISTNNDSTFFKKEMTFYLQHRKNEAALYQAYRNNAYELNKVDTYIKLYKKEIKANKSHLYVVSYVNPREIHNPKIINRSSVRASILRAYIKVKHEIGHEHVAFAIDTIDQRPNVTSITYVPQPANPDFSPLYCTLKRDRSTITCSVQRYRFIPIANKHESISTNKPQQQHADFKIDSIKELAIRTPFCKNHFVLSMNIPTNILPFATVKAMEPEAKSDVVNTPFMGLKTNVLYWCGITPEMQYKGFMPNLEVEWYIKKQISLNMELVYTYLEENNTNRKMWGLSAVSLEPRYWFAKNGQYNGLYAGCYGLIGDFDVKKDRMEADGDTGDFYEAGMTMGYHLPISNHWGVELGGKIGYRTASGDTYYFDDPHYYRRMTFSENKLKVTGLRIMLVYRFHKSIKKGGRQ